MFPAYKAIDSNILVLSSFKSYACFLWVFMRSEVVILQGEFPNSVVSEALYRVFHRLERTGFSGALNRAIAFNCKQS